MRARLHKSAIGIVALNWKYIPEKKDEFLKALADYGFTGIQVSPEQSRDASFRDEMEKNKIASAEIYVPIKCTVDGVVAGADHESKAIIDAGKESGVHMVVFAIDGSDDRDLSAGNASSGPGLSPEGFASVADHVERWAEYAKSAGMKSSFHPHGATYIETPEETRRLMGALSKNVGLCLDTGHWIVGGGDPVSAVREYGARITHVHVKDVSGDVLKKMLSREIGKMSTAVDDFKLFVPAGTGLLHLQDLFTALDECAYSGWLMSEQDTAWEPTEEKSAQSFANMTQALSA